MVRRCLPSQVGFDVGWYCVRELGNCVVFSISVSLCSLCFVPGSRVEKNNNVCYHQSFKTLFLFNGMKNMLSLFQLCLHVLS